jgi:hypothetical protein
VWLNGASKLDGYWLLRIGVIPVYVIHTYQEDIDFPVSNKSIQDRQQQDFAVDFVRHTHADRLNHGAWNSYLMSPSQVDHKEPSTVVHDGFQRVAQFVCDEPSSSRSASWSFRVAQRENKLSAADVQVPSEDTTRTGRDEVLAGMAQGDPTPLLPPTVPNPLPSVPYPPSTI